MSARHRGRHARSVQGQIARHRDDQQQHALRTSLGQRLLRSTLPRRSTRPSRLRRRRSPIDRRAWRAPARCLGPPAASHPWQDSPNRSFDPRPACPSGTARPRQVGRELLQQSARRGIVRSEDLCGAQQEDRVVRDRSCRPAAVGGQTRDGIGIDVHWRHRLPGYAGRVSAREGNQSDPNPMFGVFHGRDTSEYEDPTFPKTAPACPCSGLPAVVRHSMVAR